MSPPTGTPMARSTRSIFATSPVWLLGALAAVAAAIVTELFALVARALGVPMEAGSPGADAATPIPFGGFAGGTLMWSASSWRLSWRGGPSVPRGLSHLVAAAVVIPSLALRLSHARR